jgi:hypothetical protein
MMIRTKKHRHRNRRAQVAIRKLLPAGLALASCFHTSRAQTDAFTRQVECPNDPSIMGYTSIQDLTRDMEAELARIGEAGEIPDIDYILNICPSDEPYTLGDPIKPINRAQIYCGGPAAVDATCIITGERTQVRIGDLMVEGLPDYSINEVLFQGITFDDFSRRSAQLQASAPAVASFVNCIWQVSFKRIYRDVFSTPSN